MNRLALQVINGAVALATIGLGAMQLAFGSASPLYRSAALSGFPILDSNLRFFGGMAVGLGLVLLWALPSIERHPALYRAFWLCAFLGGMGRVISATAVGWPSGLLMGFAVLEVVGAPVLVYWHLRLTSAATQVSGP